MTVGEKVTNGAGSGDEAKDTNNSTASEHDPQFEPIVILPEVVVSTMEEDEEEMIKLRAKLYRFDSSETPSEWKDRGTGEVKLLKHRTKSTIRVVMRRDKTLKICANHYVTPWMELSPNCGSDRAWVWSVEADYAEETPRSELLAIRFASAEIAQRWKEKFDEAKAFVAAQANLTEASKSNEEDSSDEEEKESKEVKEIGKEDLKDEATEDVVEQLEKLDVGDKQTGSVPAESVK